MIDRLPDHESGLRRLIADSTGGEYRAVRSLDEARAQPDGFVVLEGDDGGQIYAVFPAGAVERSAEALEQLLHDLDEIAWPGNAPNSARVFYERHRAGSPIPGGMGGGNAAPGGWIHDEFKRVA